MQDDSANSAQDDVQDDGADDSSQDSGTQNGGDSSRSSSRKPMFSEEQNRWIGRKLGAEESKRRGVEGERDAAKTQVTSLTERVTSLERDLRLSRAENAVIAEATKLKADDPSIIYRLVKDDLQFGDDGKPKDVAALLEQYKKDHPKLFGAVSTSGADGGKGGDRPISGENLNQWFRDQAAKSKTRATSSAST